LISLDKKLTALAAKQGVAVYFDPDL
jgi:hypothetical protein